MTKEIIQDLLTQLYSCNTSQECVELSEKLAEKLKSHGSLSLQSFQVLDNLLMAIKDKKSGLKREGGLLGLGGLAKGMGRMAEPYLLPCLPLVLDSLADKGQPVREAAEYASSFIMDLTCKYATFKVLSTLYECLEGGKWQAKKAALEILKDFAKKAPLEMTLNLPEIIEKVELCLHDTKSEVSNAAIDCLTVLCGLSGNEDIEPHIPILVDCMAHPTAVVDCIKKLSSTTFVADMTAPALAIMIPLLVRALNERSNATLRPTSIIIDNLCKLVKNPNDAGRFLPQLLPGLDKIIETASIPEVRQLASTAKETLVRAGAVHSNSTESNEPSVFVVACEITSVLSKALGRHIFVDNFTLKSCEYLSLILAQMIILDQFNREEWLEYSSHYLSCFLLPNQSIHEFVDPIFKKYHDLFLVKSAGSNEIDNQEEGEELCNCEFSLAYGSRMLLNRTRLRLVRGQRYGLCGANGAGKSTLMRSISLGKVEGFPTPEELKTVFVEHSLQGEDAQLSVLDFVCNDFVKSGQSTSDQVIEALESVGFTSERQAQAVGALSGGWKMKLELARAMLSKADILLLDEPTNHLDVDNIKWLEDYLNKQTNITSMIVSHDSGFLDNVCTYIIHYETKKLVFYKGNLSKFVEKKPEAKSYYTLAATTVQFKFPPPSILLGIRSNTKAILKMSDCTYTYPGTDKPSISDVSVQLSLSSRVAVVGHNGAGKSTMIKILTGEVIPQQGQVWKHPNLRIGYVAQHAFHHLNQHLEKTPNGYLQWRYQGGQDKELLEKASRKLTTEDLQQMETVFDVNGEQRRIEYLVGRAKLKKSFQYEIKWVGKLHKFNTWLSREELLERGFTKLVQAFDDQEASREGQGYRELVPSVIRKHFEDIGLDGDIADNSPVGGLSGGQKVKVVLAAAMWNNPHMLVLDEPTNYLDRESLGGLAVAIRDWGGAVIMISHNTEFIGALCPETWNVAQGRLTLKGKSAVDEEKFEDHVASAEKIAIKAAKQPKKKKLTRNDLKAREVRRRQRHIKWLIEGGEKEPDTESD